MFVKVVELQNQLPHQPSPKFVPLYLYKSLHNIPLFLNSNSPQKAKTSKQKTKRPKMKLISPLLSLLALALVAILSVNGQTNVPCSASMLSSFSPCLNFVTNSSANGTSPTADCCNSIRSLASGSRDCLCLIVTGGVPFQIPINRTLAISLPRACNLPGVPLQCNGIQVSNFSLIIIVMD